MTGFGLVFALATATFLVSLPRRWSVLPLLIGATYMPVDQEVEIGPFHFTALRLLIALGFLRVTVKGEWIARGVSSLDRLMIVWATWLICSSVFHVSSVFITRLGVVFDSLGVYFLFRVFLQTRDDVRNVFKIVCVLFVPLAAAMVVERLTGKNCFALFGVTSEGVLSTGGHFRARGAFEHPILAGTVGAACLPMAIYLWQQERKVALVGLAATSGVIVASASSGPIMTAISILGGLALWRIRRQLRAIFWLGLFFIVALSVVMNDPVYYLIGRIDITGGSTGWYRAALIQSAIDHLNEWWLTGTDVTRGWMHVSISQSHSDITNQYIQMGVWGGLLLIWMFTALLFAGFAGVGRALRISKYAPFEQQFMIWTLGSILFGHVTTFLSISYFDQSAVFFYLVLAIIASVDSAMVVHTPVTIGDASCSSPAVNARCL
jgi:hypothetical protein